MRFASTHVPLNSDEERELEKDFIGSGAHVEVEYQGEVNEDSEFFHTSRVRHCSMDPPIDQRTRKTPRVSKSTVDTALEVWTKSMNEKMIRRAAKQEALSSTDTIIEKYSIEECMKKLNSIPNLDRESYARACTKFISLEWRTMFMLMDEENIRYIMGPNFQP